MAKADFIIHGANVKVMRSYDYCHFEVALSSAGTDPLTSKQVNAMRKEAMRLTDEAVKQYKIARACEDAQLREKGAYSRLQYDVARIEEIPEDERTPEMKAKIKALQDFEFHSQFDYEDDYDEWWDED